MSTSDNEAAAAFEASISVADDVEVAGDRIPKSDPALDSDLDLDLLEPARPGSPQQEQHQQSHPWFNAQPDGSDAAEPARSGSPQHEQHQQSHPWFNAQPAGLDDAEPAIATNGVGQGDGINQENGYDAENGNKQPNDRPGSRGSNGSPQNGNHVNGERKGPGGGAQNTVPGAPSFPIHNSPRVWLLTQATSPLVIRLIRLLLAHGDCVAACVSGHELEDVVRGAEIRELIKECKSDRKDREEWIKRLRCISCDGRSMGTCSQTIAQVIHVFGRIDILLCCKFEGIIGTVEELSTTPATRNLVRDQMETVYFSQANLIKAVLPELRAKQRGHILILTDTGGHIGTPGMPAHAAATWALEGFCDSLAYEIAPFNIKVTIIQPNKEVHLLTNNMTFTPQLPWYDSGLIDSGQKPVPTVRDMLSDMLNKNADTAIEASMTEIQHRYPQLPAETVDGLVKETLHALIAIGGLENPPARHIVGHEAASEVKEKLATVTKELEVFVEASLAVDIFDTELKTEARENKAPASGEAEGVGEQHMNVMQM